MPEPPDHLTTGRAAEERAARLLAGQGYEILEQNFRAPRGELDLVARHGEYLVFIEVRARGSDRFGDPSETIGSAKRAALIRAARSYLTARGDPDLPIRFDVVTFSGSDLEEIRVIRNAIEVEDPWR